MANGAPAPGRRVERQLIEEERKALEELQAELEARGPFDELLEVRNFQMTLLRLADDAWALVMDTPGRRRYAFPLTTQAKDGLNELLSRTKLQAAPGEVPPDLRGRGQ